MEYECDVAVIGMGIMGVAHAYSAAKAGKKVILVESRKRATGASIRNFGFVTISGQAPGEMWNFSRRTREVWGELASNAGIKIHQNGVDIIAQREESAALLEAFQKSEMGQGCELMAGSEYSTRTAAPFNPKIKAVLHSPFEMRINPGDALDCLHDYLQEKCGVKILRQFLISSVESGLCESVEGKIRASLIYLCTGDSLNPLHATEGKGYDFTRCKLQMLRIASKGLKFSSTIMSDLSLVRYSGFAGLPEAQDLKNKLRQENAAQLAHGIHLILAQDIDGSLIIGDSHEYDDQPSPFQSHKIDTLILEALNELLQIGEVEVLERWIGTYAYHQSRDWFINEVAPAVYHTVITSGAGMSTSFAIAEKNVQQALNLT